MTDITPSSETTLLIAEDDPNLRQGLVDLFEDEGYTVVPAADGEQAWQLYLDSQPNLLLLDVMMPQLSGFDLCRRVRQQDETTPVLLLTAKGEEIDKVVGLELGADDYITKPFGLHELRARVKAALRRCSQGQQQPPQIPDEFTFGAARINRLRLEATLNGNRCRLTARELKLLETFYSHPGEVLNRDFLLNAAWGIDYQGTTRTLDQHIAQLRKKIEPQPDAPQAIQTAHGIGYRYPGSCVDKE